MTRVRFAPTPAGNLFISGARLALANDLFARRAGGHLLLRFDDLDIRRAGSDHADQIIHDLSWFGIEWHDTVRQSERVPLYQDAIERLRSEGFLYPCFESEEELKAKQEFRRKRGQSPIYDRAMLKLTDKQRQDALAGGKRPHWRFKLSGRTLEWHDMIQGSKRATLSAVSDPVLVLADDSPSPLLASVVDDIENRTSHIIRGENSAGNTAVQIELFEVLARSAAPVRFAHLPALTEASPGGRRTGNASLRSLRNDGVEPSAISACLVSSSHGDPLPLDEAAATFRLRDMAAARFDTVTLLSANRRVLSGLPFAAVANRLPDGATEAFWLAVRGSLDLLKEARGWWDVVAGSIVPPVIEGERDLLLLASSLLPPEPWDAAAWSTWITALRDATDRSGEALLTPLRLALTGEDSGPDLASLLPLIGRSCAANRLEVAAA